jgi:hypothetical protein
VRSIQRRRFDLGPAGGEAVRQLGPLDAEAYLRRIRLRGHLALIV